MMGQGREALVVCSNRSMKIGITIWDVDTGDEILKIPSCAASSHGFLCLRNQCLAASQVNRYGSLGGGTIFMWALNKPHPPCRSYTMEAMGPISCTRNGEYLAGGSQSGNAYLWEVRSGRLLKMWHAHYQSIKCMVFSDDGYLLISGSDDGLICIWSVTGLLKQTYEIMHHSDQLDQKLIKMQELESSHSLLHYSLEHKSSITGLLTISGSTGLFVSSSLDATCKVWELSSGSLVQTQVYPLALTAIAFHLGEQLLFAGSADGRIFVSTLEFLLLEDHSIVGEDQQSVLRGHNGSITALAFSASHLISASEDKTVCLWDFTRRVIIRRFNHQKGAVTNLVVIPQSSLVSEVSTHQRKSKKNHISSLEKYPQPNNLSMEMVILLQSCFFNKDDQCSINIRRTKSLFQHMSELQQEGTPAALQMRADVSLSHRTWASQMTKHLMEMNKHLQSRLLDLMQCRILCYNEVDSLSSKSRTKRKIESPSLHRKKLAKSSGSLLYHDKVSCPRRLHSFKEFGSKASELHGHAIVSSTCNVNRSCKPKAIQAIVSSEGGVESVPKSGGGLRGKLNKVVLAYSGGLDTSVIVPWLRENYGCEVVCFTADVGQGIKELDGLEEKAKASGACQLVVKDLKEEFVKDYIYPCLRAGAIYERKYLLGTSMARPVIAKAMVDVARDVGADAVAHGCTGKGNDQVRFELTFFALNPELNVVAPWREWDIQGREDAIEYAKKHNVPVPVTKKSIYSRDRNLWHLSHEGDILEDPANEPNKDMYMMSVDPEEAPNQPEYIEIGIVSGLPVSVNGKKLSPASLLAELNEIGGRHGIGRIDMVENRLVGMKSRGVYETPGGTILFNAVSELESLTLDRETMQVKDSLALKYAELVYAGRWFDPLRVSMDAFMEKITETTTGSVTLKLYKGSVSVTGRTSSNSLYRQDISSFESGQIYDQADAAGFIRLYGLPMRVRAMLERGI